MARLDGAESESLMLSAGYTLPRRGLGCWYQGGERRYRRYTGRTTARCNRAISDAKGEQLMMIFIGMLVVLVIIYVLIVVEDKFNEGER